MADGLFHSRTCALSTVAARITGTHADVPVLFTAANLPAEMFDVDGGHAAQAGGGDIRFSADSAGLELLPCDVVAFATDDNPAPGRAQIWVRLPHVRDSQADAIHVWWGVPGAASQPAPTAPHGRDAVWAEAELVVLMDAAAPVDRSGNHALVCTGALTVTEGPFGSALAFGAGARIYNTTDAGLRSILTTFDTTIEVVSRRAALDANRGVVSINGADDWILYPRDGTFSGQGVRVFWRDAGGNILNPMVATGPGWAWTAFSTRASDDHRLHLAGVEVAHATQSASVAGPFSGFCIGDWLDGSQPWGGDIQAVIVWKSARSTAWLLTGYASQSDPATFIAVGTPQDTGGEAADLAISGALHAQAAEMSGLRQAHRLAVVDTRGAQAAGVVTLRQRHALLPASGAHTQEGDSVSFDGTARLAVAASVHAQRGGLAALGQWHRLAVAAGFHGQWAALSGLGQIHGLGVADVRHGLRAGGTVLTLASAGAPAGRTVGIAAPPGAIAVPSDEKTRSIGAAQRTFFITSSR